MNKNKNLVITCFLLTLFSSGVTHANDVVREFIFEPNKIYPVNTSLGVVTQIELSPREVIKDYSSGLSSGWDVVRRDNVFYLKPKNQGVDTNFIVRTQSHQYIFELKVINPNWKKLSEIKSKGINYQIKFQYPENTDFNIKSTKISGFDLKYSSSRTYHTNYDVAYNSDSQWLVPKKVYDDEKFTYIYLNKGKLSGDFPTVYARKEIDGQEFVLNSNVENDIIVVHGIYPFLVLRHGKNVVGLRRN